MNSFLMQTFSFVPINLNRCWPRECKRFIHALVVFVSEISLVRFLIRQQLVRKYRTPALSMKYSVHTAYLHTIKGSVNFQGAQLSKNLCFSFGNYKTKMPHGVPLQHRKIMFWRKYVSKCTEQTQK